MLFRRSPSTIAFLSLLFAFIPPGATAADFESLRLTVQGTPLGNELQALADGREVYLPLAALPGLGISFTLDRREETAEVRGKGFGPVTVALARIRSRPMAPLSSLLGPCKLDRAIEKGVCEIWSRELGRPADKKPTQPSPKPAPADPSPPVPAVSDEKKTEAALPSNPQPLTSPVQGAEKVDTGSAPPPGPPSSASVPMGLAKPLGPMVSLTDVLFVSMNNSHAQVQIRTLGQPGARTRLRFDPARLEVELLNAAPGTAPSEWLVEHPFVEKIVATSGDLPGTLRITLTLKQLVAYRQLDPSPVGVILNLSLPRGAGRKFEEVRVVVDAGHGGRDTGCQSKSGGVCTNEKDLTLSIARMVAQRIGSAGATAVLTRDSDIFIPLKERPAVATRNNADLFVSIHINSCKIPNRASGSSTYYHKADSSSRALAQSVLGRIARVSGLPSLGAMSDRTLYANGLAVLRHSAVPATLVEVAFLNHAGDRKLLRTEEFRNRIARAIAEGIKGYFDASLPDAPAAESAEALLQTR